MSVIERMKRELDNLAQDIGELEYLQRQVASARGADQQEALLKLENKISEINRKPIRGPRAQELKNEALDKARAFRLAIQAGTFESIIREIETAASGLEEPTQELIDSAERLFFPRVADAVGKMSDAVVKIDALADELEKSLKAVESGDADEGQAKALVTAAEDAFNLLKALLQPDNN